MYYNEFVNRTASSDITCAAVRMRMEAYLDKYIDMLGLKNLYLSDNCSTQISDAIEEYADMATKRHFDIDHDFFCECLLYS